MRGIYFKLVTCIFIALCSNTVAAKDYFQVVVKGNTMSWGADTFGYIQVQDSLDYKQYCDVQEYQFHTGESADINCTLDPGTYNVTNHTLGQRIERIVIDGNDGVYTAPMPEIVGIEILRYDPYQAIDANAVYSPLSVLPAPANLYADVYSPHAAELFWDRALEPDLEYEIYIGNERVGSTNGTSYFLDTLTPRNTWIANVVAKNTTGTSSDPASVSFRTGDDGSAEPAVSQLFAPTGLRARVYSENTLELIWDRQEPFQQFEVSNGDGDVLTVTQDISFFLTGLPPLSKNTFYVATIDAEGNKSSPATITVDTKTDRNITIHNAEDLLAEIVRFANQEPFEAIENKVDIVTSAVIDTALSFVQNGSMPENVDFRLSQRNELEITDDTFGGTYFCKGGGGYAGARSIVIEGDIHQSHVVLYNCGLSNEPNEGYVYTGVIRKDNAVDNGDGTLTNEAYFNDVEIKDFGYFAYDKYNGFYSNRAFSGVNNTETQTRQVDEYNHQPLPFFDNGSNSLLEIYRYNSIVQSSIPNPDLTASQDNMNIQRTRSASADVTFDVSFHQSEYEANRFPFGFFAVNVDLQYTGDSDTTDAVALWNSGEITITSILDGSQLVATPVDTDGDSTFESMSITVRDKQIIRPLSDGYLVSCRRQELNGCNVESAE